jgi:hypothetical protein
VIGVLSELPLMLFDKMDIGKTNAARPSNTSRMMIPKRLMDVLKLKKKETMNSEHDFR